MLLVFSAGIDEIVASCDALDSPFRVSGLGFRAPGSLIFY